MGRSIRSRTPWAQTRDLELGVEAGQVVCPRVGIIDIERCFTCTAYRGVHDGPQERLVCAPRGAGGGAFVPYGTVPR